MTLMKNMGGGGVMVNQPSPGSAFHRAAESPNYPLHVQLLTNSPFSIPFVLIFMHRIGGVGGPYPPSAFRRSDNDSQIYPISFHTLPHSLPKTRSLWVHESPAYPGALGSTSHQSRITSHHLCHQSALCPTGYLSRGRASSVLLERTAPSNKLPTGHRSFFLLHGRV